MKVCRIGGNWFKTKNKMEKRVSVIIPIYNAETYLAECLYSVVNQTFHDIEVILVNDGSNESTVNIMKAFANEDSRIKIISQPNKGVSAARNSGLQAATGEYVLFIDSDDMIMPNSIETLLNNANETVSDLLLGNAIRYIPDVPLSVAYKRNEELIYQRGIRGEEYYIKLMEVKNAFPTSVFLYFVKRNLLIEKNLFFKEGIIHENELWCINTMINATRVAMIDFNYYYCRQHKGSLMDSGDKKFRIVSLFIVAKEVWKLANKLKKENKPVELTNTLYIKIFNLLGNINKLRRESQSYEQPILNEKFFSKLLLEIYPGLSYSKQREFLLNYYFFNPTINNRVNMNSKII